MGEVWKNPPVIYVLVQLNFEPLPSKIEEAADGLKEHFERLDISKCDRITAQLLTIKVTNESPQLQVNEQLRWLYRNSDQTEGYILSDGSLIYHTTNYKNWAHFHNRVVDGYSCLQKFLQVGNPVSIGIRILDAIELGPQDTVARYLRPERTVLQENEVQTGLVQANSETVQEVEGGYLRSGITFLRSGLPIPSDLFPLHLELGEKWKVSEGRCITLDHDFTLKTSSPDWQKNLKLSKDILDAAFKSCVTEDAIKLWKGER